MKTLLTLLALTMSSVCMAQVNCASLWFAGFPYPGAEREPFSCIQHPASLPWAQLYYPESERLDPQTIALANAAGEALRESWDRFNSLRPMQEVRVVLYTRPAPSAEGVTTFAEAQIRWHRPGELCPVLIYPEAKTFSPEGMKQVIAHELFHCFQRKHFAAQALLGANPEILQGLWGLEGTAQFMSNWVYPRTDLEYSEAFDPYQPQSPLVNHPAPYGTVHFFQSLANQRGVESILSFLERMPESVGGNQEEALTSIEGIEDLFHSYAKDMTAHTLRDSGGHVGATPEVRATTLASLTEDEGSQERQLQIFPGTIMPYRLSFPKKGNYRLQWVLPEGARGSYRRVGESNWRPLPEIFETGCENDEVLEILVSLHHSSIGAETAFVYAERAEKDEACPCDFNQRPNHSCLYGTWEVDSESVLNFMRRLMPPEIFTMESATGSFKVRFTRDGEVNWIMENWVIRMRMKLPGRRGEVQWAQVTSTTNGENTGRYSNQGRTRMCAGGNSSTVVTMQEIQYPDGRVIRQPAPPILPEAGRMFTYECQGDQLLYKEALGAGPNGSDLKYDYLFRRL